MVKKPIKSPPNGRRTIEATKPSVPDSKQNAVLAMLRHSNGASIAEIVEATSWQPHSVRGFMSGALKKRLGINVTSKKGENGVRRYYVAPSRG